jgi:hypothetical protein
VNHFAQAIEAAMLLKVLFGHFNGFDNTKTKSRFIVDFDVHLFS